MELGGEGSKAQAARIRALEKEKAALEDRVLRLEEHYRHERRRKHKSREEELEQEVLRLRDALRETRREGDLALAQANGELEALTFKYHQAEHLRQSSERECAALWMSARSTEGAESIKASSTHELQMEAEEAKRKCKALTARNQALSRELIKIDQSLVKALQDHGLTLDDVNPPRSSRMPRRSHSKQSLESHF